MDYTSPRVVGVNRFIELQGIGMPTGGKIENWRTSDEGIAIAQDGFVVGVNRGVVDVNFDYNFTTAEGYNRVVESEAWDVRVLPQIEVTVDLFFSFIYTKIVL